MAPNIGVRVEFRTFEDRLAQRTRVLWVDVNTAGLNRASGDPSAAETKGTLHLRLAHLLDDLGDHFSQQIAFGKRLRPHSHHRFRGGPNWPCDEAASERNGHGSNSATAIERHSL